MSVKDLNRKAQDLANERGLNAVAKITISSEHAAPLRALFHEMANNKHNPRSEHKTIILKKGVLEILGHQTNFNEVGASFNDDGVRKAKGDFILYVAVDGKAQLTRNNVLARLALMFRDKAFNDALESRFKTEKGRSGKSEGPNSIIMAGRKTDIRVRLAV